jgi:hypothetical protein
MCKCAAVLRRAAAAAAAGSKRRCICLLCAGWQGGTGSQVGAVRSLVPQLGMSYGFSGIQRHDNIMQAIVCTRQRHFEGRSDWQHTALRWTPGRGRASTLWTPTPVKRTQGLSGCICQPRCDCCEMLALHPLPPYLLIDTALSDMAVYDGAEADPSGTAVRQMRELCGQPTASTLSAHPCSS